MSILECQLIKEVYLRVCKYMPEEKYFVFHDGFDLTAWKDFMGACRFFYSLGYSHGQHDTKTKNNRHLIW